MASLRLCELTSRILEERLWQLLVKAHSPSFWQRGTKPRKKKALRASETDSVTELIGSLLDHAVEQAACLRERADHERC